MSMNIRAASLLASTTLVVGCVGPIANLAPTVGETRLEDRTEFALGLSAEKFEISDIAKDGGRTEYTATTSAGVVHRCYVTSLVGSVGTSDAICSGTSAANREVVDSETGQCNALLEAAGKC